MLEQLGGLPTPRQPVEIVNNKILTKEGLDLTKIYIHGAKEALKIAKLCNCKYAILKDKSPSCGNGLIYDGTFKNSVIKGDGLTTNLFRSNLIEVINPLTLSKI